MHEDPRLKSHLHATGLDWGAHPRHRRFKEPGLAAEQANHVRIAALERSLVEMERMLATLVLAGMQRAAEES